MGKANTYGYKSEEWYFLRGGNRQYLGERTLEDSECYECPRSFLMQVYGFKGSK